MSGAIGTVRSAAPLDPSAKSSQRGSGIRVKPARVLTYVLLIAAAIYFLVPVYILVATGFKPFAQANVFDMWAPPTGLSFASFATAWQTIGPSMINSALITVPAALISAFLGSVNGYIFSKWRFRGSNLIYSLFLFGMFLPYQGVLIPLVFTLQAVGLYGSIVGVIVVHSILGIPITALMFRGYYASVPDEIIESAKLDGAGFFGIYRHILAPIAIPAFAVVLLWQFTTIWNDYLIGLVILGGSTHAPVMVAIQNLAASDYVKWNVQMAGALIAAIPTIVVYLALGKLFLRGLLSGALKG